MTDHPSTERLKDLLLEPPAPRWKKVVAIVLTLCALSAAAYWCIMNPDQAKSGTVKARAAANRILNTPIMGVSEKPASGGSPATPTAPEDEPLIK